MQTQDAYNDWAQTYDTVNNPTRDLEAIAIRTVIATTEVEHIVEIGCGTGKNTQWLRERCRELTAVDFSEEMMQVAKEKVNDDKVRFLHADITKPWNIEKADLITCSLVLEHIENLDFIFQQAAIVLNAGGLFYLCELHPYKQLQGSRARFEKGGELLHLEHFIHHISDYFNAALQNDFACEHLNEWFDTEDRTQTPRLVSFVFRKR